MIHQHCFSHYLNQCWPRYQTPYRVTRPHCVNNMKNSFPEVACRFIYIIPALWYVWFMSLLSTFDALDLFWKSIIIYVHFIQVIVGICLQRRHKYNNSAYNCLPGYLRYPWFSGHGFGFVAPECSNWPWMNTDNRSSSNNTTIISLSNAGPLAARGKLMGWPEQTSKGVCFWT